MWFSFQFCFSRLQAKNQRTKVVIIFVPLIKSANYNYFFIVICTLFGFLLCYLVFPTFFQLPCKDIRINILTTMSLMGCIVLYGSFLLICTIISKQYYVTYVPTANALCCTTGVKHDENAYTNRIWYRSFVPWVVICNYVIRFLLSKLIIKAKRMHID